MITSVMTGDGYACEPSPDRSAFSCTHEDRTDLSFAYLPQSNLVQVWAVFSRSDDGLDPRWQGEACDGVHKDVNAVNDELIIKLVCTPEVLRFETVTWVPDGGLNGEDVRGFTKVFETVIGEVIRDRMLPAAPAPTAPAATDAAATDI